MTMHRRTMMVMTVLAVCGLQACAAPQARPVQEVDFSHGSPLLLNVRVAEIDSKYRPQIAPPNIERSVSPSPEAALIKWAQQRIRSDGSENVARFTILNAPLAAENLVTQGGVVGAFTTEPAQRWTVTLEAQMEILDDSGARLDGYTAKVARSRDLRENATGDQRRAFWSELLAAAMGEFDVQMRSGLQQYAGKWIR